MPTCRICGKQSVAVARVLGICGRCVRERFEEAQPCIAEAHATARRSFELPTASPQASDGISCTICSHQCRIPNGGVGYCGLPASDRRWAKASWYHDPLPTNCVADFVCPGGTGRGFPKFAYRTGAERGYRNLAVFYEACSLNCLFCQNWQYRYGPQRAESVSPERLADAVDDQTACICFFGGDPTPQLPHSLEAARRALDRHPGRILRICWETNGNMNPNLLDRMADLSLQSGGCIKFDLKAWHENVALALTGSSNRRTLENFVRLAHRIRERPEVPLLIASTLLVPGYVDTDEVGAMARFIARFDPDLPYSLLAFHPTFLMRDLPPTSSKHMRRCHQAAVQAGLKTVHVGNPHLLQPCDYGEP